MISFELEQCDRMNEGMITFTYFPRFTLRHSLLRLMLKLDATFSLSVWARLNKTHELNFKIPVHLKTEKKR